MRKLLFFLILLLSCNFNTESNDNIVARAGEKTLTKEELIDKLPKIINLEDSIIISNKIINNWALNQLLIENAEINLSSEEIKKIEKISSEYYYDLLISTYKNKVASYNSDTLVLDNEISEYYNSNFDNFLLYEDIIKGRYVRLNKNNFNLNEIKRRFRRFNEQDLTFFDSISLQLLNYSLNDTTWVNKDLFFNKIPVLKDDEIERIVKKTLYVVKEDSLDVYLIKINDFIGINDKAPLDYIYNRIEELVKNKKKVDFIKKFETETIENAKIENNFKIIK
ncbi:MAG: peptidylprolyl isomerase [Flavobacteriaceae bacterium]|nr:peptidylprolyl isomerase [Flavobacteriaceae bacterium]